MKWKPIDVISLVIVVGCFILIIVGHNSFIHWTLLAVVGAYYGIDLTPFIKLGRNQNKKED